MSVNDGLGPVKRWMNCLKVCIVLIEIILLILFQKRNFYLETFFQLFLVSFSLF